MKIKLPSLSLFAKGKKVTIGKGNTFELMGIIVDIVPEDEFPIKVDANIGQLFELSVSDYGVSWSLEE